MEKKEEIKNFSSGEVWEIAGRGLTQKSK